MASNSQKILGDYVDITNYINSDSEVKEKVYLNYMTFQAPKDMQFVDNHHIFLLKANTKKYLDMNDNAISGMHEYMKLLLDKDEHTPITLIANINPIHKNYFHFKAPLMAPIVPTWSSIVRNGLDKIKELVNIETKEDLDVKIVDINYRNIKRFCNDLIDTSERFNAIDDIYLITFYDYISKHLTNPSTQNKRFYVYFIISNDGTKQEILDTYSKIAQMCKGINESYNKKFKFQFDIGLLCPGNLALTGELLKDNYMSFNYINNYEKVMQWFIKTLYINNEKKLISLLTRESISKGNSEDDIPDLFGERKVNFYYNVNNNMYEFYEIVLDKPNDYYCAEYVSDIIVDHDIRGYILEACIHNILRIMTEKLFKDFHFEILFKTILKEINIIDTIIFDKESNKNLHVQYLFIECLESYIERLCEYFSTAKMFNDHAIAKLYNVNKLPKFGDIRQQRLLCYRYIENAYEFMDFYTTINTKMFINPRFDHLIKGFENTTDKSLVQSLEFYTSIITQSHWIEEIQSSSVMGLLLNISHSDKFGKLGFEYGHSISMKEFTTCFMPAKEFMNLLDWKCKEDGYRKVKDYDEPIIKGNAIGSGNCVLPLYINSLHWEIAKQYMKPMLGLMIGRNPLDFCKRHMLYPFKILMTFIWAIYEHPNYQNERMIQTLYAVFRTCAQIAIENKYTRGLKNMVERYSRSIVRYDILMGEIISSGYVMNDNQIIDFIKQIAKCHLKKDINIADKLEKLQDSYDLKVDFVMSESRLHEAIKDFIGYSTSFWLFQMLMRRPLFNPSYNQFIKFMDKNYGLITEDICKLTVAHFKENSTEHKILNNVMDIMKEHVVSLYL